MVKGGVGEGEGGGGGEGEERGRRERESEGKGETQRSSSPLTKSPHALISDTCGPAPATISFLPDAKEREQTRERGKERGKGRGGGEKGMGEGGGGGRDDGGAEGAGRVDGAAVDGEEEEVCDEHREPNRNACVRAPPHSRHAPVWLSGVAVEPLDVRWMSVYAQVRHDRRERWRMRRLEMENGGVRAG
eukprot:1242955-Rhodomonas_salina.3